MYYLSMVLAIAGLVTYQIFMKAAPRAVNPWWLMALVYILAALACLPAGALWKRFVSPEQGLPTASMLAPAALIAMAVILIEIGYLLIYRTGWSLSVAPGVAQAVTLSVLLVLGLVLFAEKITVAKSLGLALSLAGIFLLTRK